MRWDGGALEIALRRKNKLLPQLLQLILCVKLNRILEGGVNLPSSDLFNGTHGAPVYVIVGN